VSVEGTQLTPPKKVEELSETAEALYNENVQTTYGYVQACPRSIYSFIQKPQLATIIVIS
jgi:hypothetical protein